MVIEVLEHGIFINRFHKTMSNFDFMAHYKNSSHVNMTFYITRGDTTYISYFLRIVRTAGSPYMYRVEGNSIL